MGIGCGRTCLGKPLKNHAPERFHTWERRGRRWRHGSQGLLLLLHESQFFTSCLQSTNTIGSTLFLPVCSFSQLLHDSGSISEHSIERAWERSFSWWKKLNIRKAMNQYMVTEPESRVYTKSFTSSTWYAPYYLGCCKEDDPVTPFPRLWPSFLPCGLVFHLGIVCRTSFRLFLYLFSPCSMPQEADQ